MHSHIFIGGSSSNNGMDYKGNNAKICIGQNIALLSHVVNEGTKAPLHVDSGDLFDNVQIWVVSGESEAIVQYVDYPWGLEANSSWEKNSDKHYDLKRHTYSK